MPGWLLQTAGVMALAALVIAIVALVIAVGLRRRVEAVTPDIRALAGRLEGADSQQALVDLFSHLEANSRKVGQLQARAKDLTERYRFTIQKVGLVRFNADEEIAGDLSFALVLLDAQNNGFIIASLYTLEGSRIFLREVTAGGTDHELLPEEKEALAKAIGARETPA